MFKVRFNGPDSHNYKVSSNPETWKRGGDELDVADDVAETWAKAGYVTIVDGQENAPKVKSDSPKPVDPPPGVVLDQTEKGSEAATTE